MTKTKIPYLDYCWSPCGFGCSNNCPGCWAKRMAPRTGAIIGCKACAEFRPHFHPERLSQPAKLKRPAVVGVQFTGELFDKKRPIRDIRSVLEAAEKAPWHTYVFLTQQPQRMYDSISLIRKQGCPMFFPNNWYMGLTICNQQDAGEKLPSLLKIPGEKWISFEPAIGGVRPLIWHGIGEKIEGIIIGHDNRKGAPGTGDLNHIRECAQICRDCGAKVYVKQLWIDGELRRDAKDFPTDMRHRDLPWKLDSREQGG